MGWLFSIYQIRDHPTLPLYLPMNNRVLRFCFISDDIHAFFTGLQVQSSRDRIMIKSLGCSWSTHTVITSCLVVEREKKKSRNNFEMQQQNKHPSLTTISHTISHHRGKFFFFFLLVLRFAKMSFLDKD